MEYQGKGTLSIIEQRQPQVIEKKNKIENNSKIEPNAQTVPCNNGDITQNLILKIMAPGPPRSVSVSVYRERD
jgi:hypothetical protein